MSVVVFWNDDREQSGVTLSAVAVASKVAMERNLKVLLISTAYKDFTVRNCFWQENAVMEKIVKGKNLAIENGILGLSRLISSNKIEPNVITDYTHVILKNTLEVLEGYAGVADKTPEENLKSYREITKIYPSLIATANEYYDLVFVDLNREVDEDIQQEILKQSNLNVYIAAQKLFSLDHYTELKENNPSVKGLKSFIVIGKYIHKSKYNKSNLQKHLKEKKELSVIPLNTLLFEAAEEQGIIDLFFRLNKIKDTTDNNYIFIDEVKKLGDKIIERLRELQVRMR